ncbi:alcohol dehydrogenase [soil metagenome]
MTTKSMQLTAFGHALEERHGEIPTPKGSEVLLKMLGAGVCHSDVHFRSGSYDMGPGKTLSLTGRVQFPRTLGHEATGVVVATGPDAADVEIGKTYLINGWGGCRHCPACLRGDEHLCVASQFMGLARDGGYAEHIVVAHPRYLVDIGQLDPIDAAPLACSGLTAYGALTKSPVGLDSTVPIIIGGGGIGLMAVHLVRLLEGRGAIVIDLDASKRQAALDAGALAAFDPSEPDLVSRIRAVVDGPVVFVVDFVGTGKTTEFGFEILDKGGKLVIVGLFGGAMTISIPLIPTKSATIQGSYIGNGATLRELVELIKLKGMPSLPIQRRKLSDADSAMTELEEGRVLGRIVLVP